MIKLLIKGWVYILPIPLFAVMSVVWFRQTGNLLFTAYLLLLPLLYGYVVPGIATNILGKWRFRGKMLLGNYYWHHGFKYSANMNIFLFIALGSSLPIVSFTPGEIISVLLCTSTLQAFFIWIHDIMIIKYGMLEICSGNAQGTSPEQQAFRYAPLCFFSLGFAFSSCSLIAYNAFVIQQRDSAGLFLTLLAGGFVFMTVLSSLAYRISEKQSG